MRDTIRTLVISRRVAERDNASFFTLALDAIESRLSLGAFNASMRVQLRALAAVHARRRFIALSAASAISILAITGLIYVVANEGKSQNHRTPRAGKKVETSAAYRASHLGQMNLRIAYGSTAEQVLQQLGSPSRVDRGCWLYRGRVGSIRGRYSGPYVDAMKFCFSDGPTRSRVMTRILSHTARHTIVRRDPLTQTIVSKQTYPAGWGTPITIIQPPSWYFQQSS